jgi:hypothetical protein
VSFGNFIRRFRSRTLVTIQLNCEVSSISVGNFYLFSKKNRLKILICSFYLFIYLFFNMFFALFGILKIKCATLLCIKAKKWSQSIFEISGTLVTNEVTAHKYLVSLYKKIIYSFLLQEPQLTANEQFDVYTKPFSLWTPFEVCNFFSILSDSIVIL